MSPSASMSSGPTSSSSRTRLSRAERSMSTCMGPLPGTQNLRPVHIENLPAPWLELVGEQAVVGAEPGSCDDDPADLLVGTEGRVAVRETCVDGLLVRGFLGWRHDSDQICLRRAEQYTLLDRRARPHELFHRPDDDFP